MDVSESDREEANDRFRDFPHGILNTTRLRELRFTFADYRQCRTLGNAGEGPVFDPCIDAFEMLLHLLEKSPNMELLDLWCMDQISEWVMHDRDNLMKKVRKLNSIRDLLWSAEDMRLRLSNGTLGYEKSGGDMPSLRRLVLAWGDQLSNVRSSYPVIKLELICKEFEHELPFCPNLEILVFDCGTGAAMTKLFPTPTSSLSLSTTFAQWLRDTPKLHIIHLVNGARMLDDKHSTFFNTLNAIECRGKSTGFVRSIRYGDSELLSLRMQIQDMDPIGYTPDTRRQRILHSAGNAAFADEFKVGTLTYPIWEVCHEYEGLVVPQSVLDEMREMEGISLELWNRRGVEVKKETWQVLLDWQKLVSPELDFQEFS